MSSITMHDTYAGHQDVADFVAEDGHQFVEIWKRTVSNLEQLGCKCPHLMELDKG